MITGPILSPAAVTAITKAAQPSLFSQIFSAAVANSLQRRAPSAPIVNANLAPEPPSLMPMLLVGGLAIGVVLLMMGGRRG